MIKKANYNRIFDNMYQLEDLKNIVNFSLDVIDIVDFDENSSAYDILEVLYAGAFHMKLFYNMINDNNRILQEFKLSDGKNPLQLAEEDIRSEQKSLYSLSELEVLAKSMILANRLAKVCQYNADKNAEKSCIKTEEFELTNVKKNLWFMYKGLIKVSEMDEFISIYRNYAIELEMDDEQFENHPIITKLHHWIDKANERNESKVNLDTFFSYAICQKAKEKLYQLKSYDFGKLMSKYKEHEEEMNINLVKSQNQGSHFAVDITLKDYTAPFQIHEDKDYIADLEEKYDVKLLDIVQSKYPIPAIWQSKLSTEDLDKIRGQELLHNNSKMFAIKGFISKNDSRNIERIRTMKLRDSKPNLAKEIYDTISEIDRKKTQLDLAKNINKKAKENIDEIKKYVPNTGNLARG